MSAETQADILAEMRRHIQAARDYPQDIDITAGDVEDWADRLEAAAKRERGALVAEAEAAKEARNKVAVRLRAEFAEKCRECKAKPGNAAAMRAALAELVYRKCLATGSCGRPMDELCTYTGCSWHPYRAALAAPPRNCDRYRTEADAEAAFDRFCSKERNGQCKPWECPLKSTGGKYCYVAWLLGTEGGTGC